MDSNRNANTSSAHKKGKWRRLVRCLGPQSNSGPSSGGSAIDRAVQQLTPRVDRLVISQEQAQWRLQRHRASKRRALPSCCSHYDRSGSGKRSKDEDAIGPFHHDILDSVLERAYEVGIIEDDDGHMRALRLMVAQRGSDLTLFMRPTLEGVPTGHRGGFASIKAPLVPPREHPLDYHPPVICGYCGEKCLKLISWDDGYKGHRYFGCGNAQDCNYRTWIDAPHSTFLSNLFSDHQNEVRRLKMENADGKQERRSMQTMYEARLRVKNNQLLKEEAAKDAALQALEKLEDF